MITIEQLEETLANKDPFQIKDVDHNMMLLSMLRERIPYSACPSVITGAGHDKMYLCDVDTVLEYLDYKDLETLAECNCGIDRTHGCLYLFV